MLRHRPEERCRSPIGGEGCVVDASGNNNVLGQTELRDYLLHITRIRVVFLSFASEDQSRARIELKILCECEHELILFLVRRETTDEEEVRSLVLQFHHQLGVRGDSPPARIGSDGQKLGSVEPAAAKLARVVFRDGGGKREV